MRATSLQRSAPERGPGRIALLVLAALLGPGIARPQAGGPSGGRLGQEELAELEFMRRHGDLRAALETLDEVLAADPEDHLARALRARCRLQAGAYAAAEEDARAALEGARRDSPGPEALAECARVLCTLLVELGRAPEALQLLEAGGLLRPGEDARDAWTLGCALSEAGQRSQARAVFQAGIEAGAAPTWEGLFARARCQRANGLFERAAETLVEADRLASAGEGSEPDVLVELARIYFEAYGEVDDPVARAYSPAALCDEALEIDRAHEGALLTLFTLHRFNWQRTRRSPEEFLGAALAARADSVPALVAQASAALDDGELPTARRALERLGGLAPARRDVRTEAAALAWIEHRREEAQALLEALVAQDPLDSRPEREVGWHLLELYRFTEALPFLERAVERDKRDWEAWTQLGRAQANTGDEESARVSLARAVEVSGGRRNAWRDNTALVLKRMAESMVAHEAGPLRFLWRPDEGKVLATYLVPFYGAAREELSARYGYTPGPVAIQVFRRWEDFSVRSTGFQGYPALGVCFGPVVTAVSPLCELRGTFSWARTSYHEFTHVVHLGLSNNRCPRWVTEGLATWEEGEKRSSWWRNMRRELLDARANGSVIPVRRLNNAFRGPRVLFAYYQSGLLCQMLIERHGFPPMVRFLGAFDRGADLDQALQEVFGTTPEALDLDFLAFVDARLAGLAIEPRWSPENTFQLRFRLSRQLPDEEVQRGAWADDWCRVAWGTYQRGALVDAQEALRLAEQAGELPPRGEFLRGELLLARGDEDGARAAFRAGFERGGEDYRAHMALGDLLRRKGKTADAIQEFQAAERAFPGFPDARFSAEIELARLHERAGDEELANRARMRWLEWNAGDYPVRIQVGEWLDRHERFAESVRYYEEANEVDPFRRHLHYRWGLALFELGRFEEALREYRTGLSIPAELDGDVALAGAEALTREEVQGLTGLTPEELERLSPDEVQRRVLEALSAGASEEGGDARGARFLARFRSEEALLWGEAARTLLELGRGAEARAAVNEALELDPACAPALEAQKRLP
jgi:tetratricopeptide (TPR) repeat protein